MVLGRGLRLSLAGIAAGTVASLGLAQLLQGLLFGVNPRDWMAFVSMPLVVAVVAVAAVWLPARRAARLDPIAALQHE